MVKRSLYEELPFDPEELEAIYFGCRMIEEDRLQFTDLVASHYPHAKIIQARKAIDEFRLVFELS